MTEFNNATRTKPALNKIARIDPKEKEDEQFFDKRLMK